MASKGTTLELAVLGLLHDSPLHGYELRKRINLLLGWNRLLSYGSLYPALKRMLRAGLVTTEATPGTTAVSRRQRIVYQLTSAGEEHFKREITAVSPSAWEDDDFPLRFVLFSRTSAEVRMRILEGRRSRLLERLERARSHRGSSSDAGADRWVNELQRHSIESVEREVRWLTDLIEAERAAPERTRQSSTQTSTTEPLPSEQHDPVVKK